MKRSGPRPGAVQHLLLGMPWPRRPGPWAGQRTGAGTSVDGPAQCEVDAGGRPDQRYGKSSPGRAYLSTRSTSASATCLPTAHRFPPDDRWAIVAYVRALQQSRNVPSRDVPDDIKDKDFATRPRASEAGLVGEQQWQDTQTSMGQWTSSWCSAIAPAPFLRSPALRRWPGWRLP